MLQIKEIVNSIFTSKTYILYKEGCGSAWLVDIGDVEPVLAFLKEKGLARVKTVEHGAPYPYRFYVSDDVKRFEAFAESILPIDVKSATMIPIDRY